MAGHSLLGRRESAGDVPPAVAVVRALTDPAEMRALLAPHRGYAAYAIAQLAPRLLPMVRFWYAGGDRGEGIVMYSGGGLGDATLMLGTPEAVEAIVRLHRGPRGSFLTCQTEHLALLGRYYRAGTPQTMARMVVDRATFRPVRDWSGAARVRRLRGDDARTVNRLYNTEGQPAFYTAAHIAEGYYHGVFVEGRLVAVAGTHVASPEERVAVVGNVFTHPAERGRGYGTLVTSATTLALLQVCDDVALTVDPGNSPAVRAYQRLGYRDIGRLIEAPVTRRDLLGAGAAWQRFRAGWRGRTEGVEIVRYH
jgi:RimJ/RimL family protein N-acetyltransferase